jgi:hypothetical protein
LEEKEFPGIIPSSFETINDYCAFFKKLIDYEEYITLRDHSKMIFTCIHSFCNGADANNNVAHYLKKEINVCFKLKIKEEIVLHGGERIYMFISKEVGLEKDYSGIAEIYEHEFLTNNQMFLNVQSFKIDNKNQMPAFTDKGGATFMNNDEQYPIKFFMYPNTESYKIMRQALDNF